MKTTGDRVLINGNEYTLGEKLGGGLEGNVFAVAGDPRYAGFAIKLIGTRGTDIRGRREIREHLAWLRNTIGADPELKNRMAVPKGLLEGDDVGYIMYRAGKEEYDSLKTYITFPEDAEAFGIWYREKYNLKKRLQILSLLFATLEKIHIAGLLFTDLSPNNIMIHREKNSLVFIDTDNMRRKGDRYLSVLGTEGYMAPEIYLESRTNEKLCRAGYDRRELPERGMLSAESDVFSAAVIAFQLLTLQHPFVGDRAEDGTAEEETAALRCETDYILHENGSNRSTTLPFVRFLDECKIVTPKIRDLFYRTFVGGKNNPHLRPTALEFMEAFDEAQDMLVICGNCGSGTVYRPERENICWDCGCAFETQTVLRIYDRYEEEDRNRLAADIRMDTSETKPGEKNKFFCLSSVVLEEGKDKFLYPRHFERTSLRDHPFARITLLDREEGTVQLSLNDKVITGELRLVRKKGWGSTYRINTTDRGKTFPSREYFIVFDVTESRVGEIRAEGWIGEL